MDLGTQKTIIGPSGFGVPSFDPISSGLEPMHHQISREPPKPLGWYLDNGAKGGNSQGV